MRSEVENVVAMIKTGVHELILSAMHNLVAARMKLTMRPVGPSFTSNPGSAVLDLDQRDFSRTQMAQIFSFLADLTKIQTETELTRLEGSLPLRKVI